MPKVPNLVTQNQQARLKEEERRKREEAAKQLNSKTVEPSPVSEAEKRVKMSIYPTRAQIQKLDELAYQYNRQHETRRIDRQDILRFLIDRCSLEDLENLV